MVYNREEAIRRAKASTRNEPGMCQSWVRGIFGVHAVGDVDRDGDADAVDGWKSEPATHRYVGDRNPPVGVPVAFGGGRNGFGHRAIVIGPHGLLRSTDMLNGAYHAGVVGNATISDIERAMGVTYIGWSETISGVKIPVPARRKVRPPLVRGALDNFRKIRDIAKAKGQSLRAKKAQNQIDEIKKKWPGK